MSDKVRNSINPDKAGLLSKQKPPLNSWLEIIISPLTWMATLTGIGLFSSIRLECNGSVIMFCAFCTVGIALFKFLKINVAYLIVPVIIVFFKFFVRGGSLNLLIIGIVMLYSYIGYLLISVLLKKKLAQKFPKENALYIAGLLPVAYFILFQLYSLIRFKEIISGMFESETLAMLTGIRSAPRGAQ